MAAWRKKSELVTGNDAIRKANSRTTTKSMPSSQRSSRRNCDVSRAGVWGNGGRGTAGVSVVGGDGCGFSKDAMRISLVGRTIQQTPALRHSTVDSCTAGVKRPCQPAAPPGSLFLLRALRTGQVL